jgi:5'-methylthioadenosine phosphorylase
VKTIRFSDKIRKKQQEIEAFMGKNLIGIIGGSGLGDVLADHIGDVKYRKIITPFGRPSGAILVGKIGNHQIAFINRHGDGHKFSPSDVPYAANIYALKKLGVKSIIASCAAGSLREKIKPKELVLADQIIDKTWRRQNSFFNDIEAVHCEMAQPLCGRLRKMLIKASQSIETKTHSKGTYVCMEGPQFSTRAESLMHRGWGGDLIGMTAMPEAKLAREAQMCYAMIAFVSDYDCWRQQEAHKDKQTLLKEIYGNLTAATENAIHLIKTAFSSNFDICSDECHCRKSLELAVWTDQKRIKATDKKKLAALFE